jgi:hypothetical protein
MNGFASIPLAAVLLGLPGAVAAAPCPVAMPVAGELSSGFGPRHGRSHPGVEIRGRVENPWPWLTRSACVPWTEIAEAPRR